MLRETFNFVPKRAPGRAASLAGSAAVAALVLGGMSTSANAYIIDDFGGPWDKVTSVANNDIVGLGTIGQGTVGDYNFGTAFFDLSGGASNTTTVSCGTAVCMGGQRIVDVNARDSGRTDASINRQNLDFNTNNSTGVLEVANSASAAGLVTTLYSANTGQDWTDGGTSDRVLIDMISLDLIDIQFLIVVDSTNGGSMSARVTFATCGSTAACINNAPFILEIPFVDFVDSSGNAATDSDFLNVNVASFAVDARPTRQALSDNCDPANPGDPSLCASQAPDYVIDSYRTGTRVPEPMTLAIMGAGLLGLGAVRRRRKLAA